MSKIFLNNEKISIVLIFSFIFMSFTQLRFSTLPIGFGELSFLLLGIIVIIKFLSSNKTKVMNDVFSNIFLLFWIFTFILLAVSYIWAHLFDIHDSSTNVIHDVLAYGFVFYIVLIMHILIKYEKIDFSLLMSQMIYYLVPIYGLLLSFTVFFGDYFGITLTFTNMVRFTGLSKNPNQLALVFVIIPFILMYYMNNKNRYLYKGYVVPFLMLSVIIGYLIESKALLLAWAISLAFILYYRLYFNEFKKFRIVLNIIFLIILLLPFVYFDEVFAVLFRLGTSSFFQRVELWSNALELIKSSPIIGFGPGAHVSSLVDSDIYAGIYWEAHNTFLDFTLQTGLLGLSLYLYLLYKIGRRLFNTGNKYLLGAFMALILFSTFHFVLRQPIFWFYLFYFYQVGSEKKCVE